MAKGARTRAKLRPRFALNPLYLAVALVVAALLSGIGWLSLQRPPAAPEASAERVELALAGPPASEPAALQQSPAPNGEPDGENASSQTGKGAPPATEPQAPSPPAEEAAPTGPETPAAPQAAPATAELSANAAPETSEPAPAAPSLTEAAPSEAAPSEAAPTAPAPIAATEAEPAQASSPEPALAAVPAEGLVEQGANGPLPAIAPDGRQPWQVYARPFDAADPRPKIAILVVGLGLSQAATNAAIALPGAVTLSFAPYAANLSRWTALARAAGHELFLDLPMEPANYPTDDPGPHTLLTSLNPEDNMARLDWLLSRFAGYVGVVDAMGTKFALSADALRPVLNALKGRGLMVLDGREVPGSLVAGMAREAGLPSGAADLHLDDVAAREPIAAALAELEAKAKAAGFALGIGRPFPVTIRMLAEWAKDLEARGFLLVPVSGAARRAA